MSAKSLHSSAIIAAGTKLAISRGADDGGYVGIKVNEINVTQLNDKGEALPIKTPNMTINLNGNQAAKLIKILPTNLSEVTAIYPKFAKAYNTNFRSLGIAANDKGPAVLISCSTGDLGFPNGKGEPTIAKYKDGTHCAVTVYADSAEDLNLDYTFNPAKDVCGPK